MTKEEYLTGEEMKKAMQEEYDQAIKNQEEENLKALSNFLKTL